MIDEQDSVIRAMGAVYGAGQTIPCTVKNVVYSGVLNRMSLITKGDKTFAAMQGNGGMEVLEVQCDSGIGMITDGTFDKKVFIMDRESKKVNLDSLMHKLFDTICSQVGSDLFCHNFYLKPDCFKYPISCDDRSIIMWVYFQFKLPNIKEDYNSKKDLEYFVTIQCAFWRKNKNAPIEIGIDYLPICQNNDCGFRITKNQAIELAKSSGFIKEGEKYSVSIEKYKWLIHKENDSYVEINMSNGTVSKAMYYNKI